GRVVAHEPEDLRRARADVLHLEVEVLRPAPALALRLAEGVSGGVDRLEGLLQLAVHVALLDEGAAHLVDDRDVLDPDRADLDTGHALHAGPEGLGLDRAEDLRVLRELGADAERRPVSHRALCNLTQ